MHKVVCGLSLETSGPLEAHGEAKKAKGSLSLSLGSILEDAFVSKMIFEKSCSNTRGSSEQLDVFPDNYKVRRTTPQQLNFNSLFEAFRGCLENLERIEEKISRISSRLIVETPLPESKRLTSASALARTCL